MLLPAQKRLGSQQAHAVNQRRDTDLRKPAEPSGAFRRKTETDSVEDPSSRIQVVRSGQQTVDGLNLPDLDLVLVADWGVHETLRGRMIGIQHAQPDEKGGDGAIGGPH